MLYTVVIFGWFFAIWDLFARGDLSGWNKGLWFLVVLLLPIVGVIIYLVTRPRDARWFAGRGDEPVIYSLRDQQIAEVETLVRLRDQGTITDDEFARMKDRVLEERPVGFPPPAPV
jgi:hypothetical protein